MDGRPYTHFPRILDILLILTIFEGPLKTTMFCGRDLKVSERVKGRRIVMVIARSS